MGLAIVIIIGGTVAYWGLQTLLGKATNAASRQVFKKTHQAVRTNMARTLQFSAPTPSAELAQCIVTAVNAHDAAPVLVSGLYLFQRTPALLVFAWGNKVDRPSFRVRVDLRETPLGCTGSFAVVDWTESGATVYGQGHVTNLLNRVKEAVTAVGGAVIEGQAA